MSSKPRKTIQIAEIRRRINNQLASETVTEESKKDLCIFIESILQETGNYNGFKYFDWVQGGWVRWVNAGKPEDKTEFLGREYSRMYF